MYVFKLRRDSSSNWVENNPILSDGEPGFEEDTRKIKVGDGHSSWTNLQYIYSAPTSSGGGGGGGDTSDEAILAHINSLTPHPVYDDGPSLFLLYENAKV